MSNLEKVFLAIHFAFKEFGHFFWGVPEPVFILTDNKNRDSVFLNINCTLSLVECLRLRNTIQFCHRAHPRAQNTAADYLSLLEVDPKDKLVIQILEDVQTLPIEINVQSAGVLQRRINLLDE